MIEKMVAHGESHLLQAAVAVTSSTPPPPDWDAADAELRSTLAPNASSLDVL